MKNLENKLKTESVFILSRTSSQLQEIKMYVHTSSVYVRIAIKISTFLTIYSNTKMPINTNVTDAGFVNTFVICLNFLITVYTVTLH